MSRAAAARAASVAVAGQPRVLSRGDYLIEEDPGGGLTVSWSQAGGPDGRLTLPALVTMLIRRVAAGEEISPVELLRMMRGR